MHQHRAVYKLLSDATRQLVITRVMQLLVAAEAANSPPVTLRESTCRVAVLSNLQRQIAWTLSRTRCAQCRCRVVVADRGGISRVQARNFHCIVKLPFHCFPFFLFIVLLFLSCQWHLQLVYICKLFRGLSHIFVDKSLCHYLTNGFCFIDLFLLIMLFSSTNTIAPIVVDTNVRTRTREEWTFHKGGKKSSKLSKARNASKKVGNDWCRRYSSTACFDLCFVFLAIIVSAAFTKEQ